MKRHLVIAPHPDDETLGCGGTLLKARDEGDEIYWLVITGMSDKQCFTTEQIESRRVAIDRVSNAYGFSETILLNFPAAELDSFPMRDIIEGIGSVTTRIKPTDIYLPHRRDAHSDHSIVFDAAISVSKWFRYSSIERTYVYETQSETDFDLSPDSLGFRPNVFVNISSSIDRKIEIAGMYNSEFAAHPFPRSFQGIRALALLRGAASGFEAAEAFMLLRQRIR
ncbi:PIG-L deacetylase family protein [Roseobacter sp. HKCCD5988]|uniref:PIG-L deacetylase family protein n=1 Tax=Roseobacter sp. HKCCD5988 TaxID=3120338 RepID=UPI0030ED4168